MFMDFETMVAHFRGFREGAAHHPRMHQLVGHYFPLFWDGSTGYLATDLGPLTGGRVVLVEIELERPVRNAYESFEAFLRDAIRANCENDGLTCFRADQ